jgi:hypothetical protein
VEGGAGEGRVEGEEEGLAEEEGGGIVQANPSGLSK